MAHDTGDVADQPLRLRNSRWRAWLRVRTPDFSYYRLGVVIPKAEDCRDHEWHNQAEGVDACYHCEVTRVTPPEAPWLDAFTDSG
jgi:hypothetical protein